MIETLLALTIIVVSIGIGFTIFENFMNATSSYRLIKGREKLDTFIFHGVLEDAYDEESGEQFVVERKISEEWPGCEQVTITYLDNAGEVCSQSLMLKL